MPSPRPLRGSNNARQCTQRRNSSVRTCGSIIPRQAASQALNSRTFPVKDMITTALCPPFFAGSPPAVFLLPSGYIPLPARRE